MRVWYWIAAVFFGLMGLAVTAWALVWRVPPDDPLRAQQIKEAAIRRMETLQAIPPADNAFADLAKVLVEPTDPAMTQSLGALYTYWTGKRTQIELDMRKSPARTKADVALAMRALPMVRAALRRPHFISPQDWRLGFTANNTNFIRLRQIAIMLTVLGIDAEMHRRPARALEYYLDAVELGAKEGRSGGLMTQMISVACQAISLDQLQPLLAADFLDAAACRDALRRLEPLPAPDSAFLLCTDEEFALGEVTIALMASGNQQALSALGWAPSAPFMSILRGPLLARDSVLYQNAYLRVRPAVQTLDVSQAAALAQPPSSSMLGQLRSKGYLADLMWFNVDRPMSQFKLLRARVQAVRLLAALRLCRLEHGTPASRLEDLVPRYLSAVPLVDTNPRTPFEYKRVGASYELAATSSLFLLLSQPQRAVFHRP